MLACVGECCLHVRSVCVGVYVWTYGCARLNFCRNFPRSLFAVFFIAIECQGSNQTHQVSRVSVH